MSQGLRHRFFGWWAGILTRYPIPILIITTVLAAASIAYAAKKWNFQSDRNLLISHKLEWNKRFIEIEDSLPGSHDMEVVVDAGPEAQVKGSEPYRAARAMLNDLGPKLERSPYVVKAVWRFEQQQANPKTVRLLPINDFKTQVDKILQSGPLLASPTPQALIGHIQNEMLAQFSQGITQLLGNFFVAPKAQAQTQTKAAAGPDDAKTAADIGDLNHLLQAFAVYLRTPLRSRTPPPDFDHLMAPPEDWPTAWQYLPSENGRLLFMLVTPLEDTKQLDPLADSLKAIRGEVAAAVMRHPGVEAGVTGPEVLDADETQAATWDSTWTSILATILITALLVLAFHSWRTPILAVLALLYGIAWTYGFLFLAVGHLQVLSVVFNVMLLGLGIAYGIYLASAFELDRHDYPDDLDGFQQTLARTLEKMGPGIATGSLTTAASFATTIFTDFTGVAEMGLIAGVGILLCLLAMFTVFPVLLRLFKSNHKHITPLEDRYVVFFQPSWAMPFVRHPVVTLAVAAVVTAASVLVITFEVRFDFDLLSLQPRNAPGMLWVQRIMRDGQEQKVWSNLAVVNSLDEGRELAAKFRQLPAVSDVGGIGMLFPADEAEKVAIIKAARAKLEPDLSLALGDNESVTTTAPATQSVALPAQSDLLAQLDFLRAALAPALAMADVPPVVRAALEKVNGTLQQIHTAMARLTPEQRAQRVDRLVRAYQAWRRESAQQIAAALDPTPLAFDDLPPAIMANYRNNRGQYILEVYPKLTDGDSTAVHSPLDPRYLPGFVEQTKSVDPQISGLMAQIYWSGRLIEESYIDAGYVAVVLVFLIVLFDYAGWLHLLVALPLAVNVCLSYPHSKWVSVGLFAAAAAVFVALPRLRRGFHDALLILVPVAMAFATTFGIMWLVGMQVNAANIIVLPLMFGIGVDSGVHVLNRYRQDPGGQPVGLTQGTGKGITITCLTSVIGFGSMILSSHRGISSLGFVLALGLAMTMLACWTVMPAWLSLRSRGLAHANASVASSGVEMDV